MRWRGAQDTVEYALLIATIATIAIAVLLAGGLFGSALRVWLGALVSGLTAGRT